MHTYFPSLRQRVRLEKSKNMKKCLASCRDKSKMRGGGNRDQEEKSWLVVLFSPKKGRGFVLVPFLFISLECRLYLKEPIFLSLKTVQINIKKTTTKFEYYNKKKGGFELGQRIWCSITQRGRGVKIEKH